MQDSSSSAPFNYILKTLIDITNTNVVRDVREATSDYLKQRKQQRNWETIQQVLGLRTQIYVAVTPIRRVVNLENLHFGTQYTGMQAVWTVKFSVNFAEIYGEKFNILLKDFEFVPIIKGLDETIELLSPVFIPDGPAKNIYFESDNVINTI